MDVSDKSMSSGLAFPVTLMLANKLNPLRILYIVSTLLTIGIYIHMTMTAYKSTATFSILGKEIGIINGTLVIIGIITLNLLSCKLIWALSWRKSVGYLAIIAMLGINYLIISSAGLIRG